MITKKEVQEVSLTKSRGGQDITLSTGILAPHCDGAIHIKMWGTELLVTAVMNRDPDTDKDYMPLAIDFRESRYAAGKIWGGRFNKREWRPSDEAVLYARLTDRPLRPMFPKGMVNDVIITISSLSLDQEISPGELSIIWSSAAVLLGGIPIDWPIGAIRIWYVDGEYVVNMTDSQAENALLDLHLAGKKWSINMIEAAANECDPEILKEAMTRGQKYIDEICDMQTEFLAQFDITTLEIKKNRYSEEMFAHAQTIITDKKLAGLQNIPKADFDNLYDTLQTELKDSVSDLVADEESEWRNSIIKIVFFNLVKRFLRDQVLAGKPRVDGRSVDQIRQIYCEIDKIERAHGTWLFRRGDTQVLAFLSLGSPSDAQMQDNMEHTWVEKRFIHHYKMPPFSNNEARMIRGTSRREIGHGRLAEKALEPMIPGKDVFPYTIRMVSEVLGSGGSTSMAAVCGSTLAMMAWWVPMIEPVSGIAMGMMSDESQQLILTDIKGTEDFIGDMDFKLTGTKNGVTAIQMDTKLKGSSVAKLHEMVDKSNAGRQQILEFMLETIAEPRAEVSPYAPFMMTYKIRGEQVRSVIWPGWSIIQKIIEDMWWADMVSIDFEDDGTTYITAKNAEVGEKARWMIKAILREPSNGDQLEGKITRVEKYGAFVEVAAGKIGLVHVRNFGMWFVADANEHATVWETMKVEVTWFKDGKMDLKRIA